MRLKLNGKPLELNVPSPSLLKILNYLDKSPADELYTAEQLSKLCGVGFNYVRDLCRKSESEGYSCIVNHSKLYGNRKAIAELRRQMETS